VDVGGLGGEKPVSTEALAGDDNPGINELAEAAWAWSDAIDDGHFAAHCDYN